MEKELKFLLYNTPRENVKIDVAVKDETIWLTQKAMAMLFGVNQPAISKHLANIFLDGELDENSVYSILEYTANDGKQYQTKFYNLDAIISVGYRINSAKATQFRILIGILRNCKKGGEKSPQISIQTSNANPKHFGNIFLANPTAKHTQQPLF